MGTDPRLPPSAITPQIVNEYIQHLGNERAKIIGLPVLYPGVKNPVAWVEKFSAVNGVESNFFESKPTSYAVGGSLDWD